jgi:DNA-binding transcriptional LysR family regulator
VELRQVEAFVRVAETGSFTRAAVRLHVTQSAVSQQIRALEREIGAQLFVRGPRRVRLSSTGRNLLPTAQDMLRCRAVLFERGGARTVAHPRGHLTVGTGGSSTVHLFARLYHAFAQEHPGIAIDARTMQRTRETIEQVGSGELDVGFAPLPVGAPGLGSRLLGYQEALLMVPRGHRLSLARYVRSRALASERFILYEPDVSVRWLTDRFFRREGFTPKVILESNDTYLIKTMVEAGLGIAFLQDWSIQEEVRRGRLRIVKLSGQPLVQEIGVIFRQHDLSDAGRVFVHFCDTHRHLLARTSQRPKTRIRAR